MKKLAAATASFLLLSAGVSHADWHSGLVDTIAFGYDGTTVTFHITGWSRSDCSCYPTWRTNMCLDRSRLTFKEELATLLAATTTGTPVVVGIDESSCNIIALYTTAN